MSTHQNDFLGTDDFGFSKIKRSQTLEELAQQASTQQNPSQRIGNFQGRAIDLPILRVPISLPKYRMLNGRTASAQQEFITSKGEQDNFFDQDPELQELQLAQHEILSNMVSEEGLLDKFKDPSNQQIDPIILDSDGFVVNGNRRLSCWRELFYEKQEKYPHFSHVDVVVLPVCEPKELDELEARLQIERDIKSDYSWHAEATMMKVKQKRYNYTSTQPATHYRKTKTDFEELFQILALGSEYLEARQKKNLWSTLGETEHTFRKLAKALNELKSFSEREQVKKLAFAFIDDPEDAGERLYIFIPKIADHIKKINSNLEVHFPAVEQVNEQEEPDTVFGDGPVRQQRPNWMDKIDDSDTNLLKAKATVVDTIDGETTKIKQKNAQDYLIKCLSRTNIALLEGVNFGLIPEANIDGAKSQIEAIERSLNTIKSFLSNKEE